MPPKRNCREHTLATAHLKALEQQEVNTPKRSRMAGNNQTQGWNQLSRNKKNYAKKKKNQQDR